jgi:hypothetical protein
MSAAGQPESLCLRCAWMRQVVSGRGSQFILCQKASEDRRFPKYPPQPIGRCSGYHPASAAEGDSER